MPTSRKPGSTGLLSPDAVRADLDRIPRMLVVRLRSLGDSILTLPLLEALQSWRADLEIDLLIESAFSPVFSHHPHLRRILVTKGRDPGAAGWSKIRTLVEIRRRRYPAVLDLHGGTTAQIFVLGSGAGIRIGEETHRRSWIYNARIPPSSAVWNRDSLHTVEHQLSVMRWLGLPIPADLRGTLHPGRQAREHIRQRLMEADISPGGYFLIQPTATLPTKQWNAAGFARVGDFLVRRYSLPVIFTSGPRESQILLDIGKNAAERHRYWSDLRLDDLFALIEGCRLFVGNDSGPTHAAAALRKPVAVVWGSSDYRAWHPWMTDYELVRSDLPCIPCPGYTCAVYGDPKCIMEIQAEAVMEACDRLLGRSSQGSGQEHTAGPGLEN